MPHRHNCVRVVPFTISVKSHINSLKQYSQIHGSLEDTQPDYLSVSELLALRLKTQYLLNILVELDVFEVVGTITAI